MRNSNYGAAQIAAGMAALLVAGAAAAAGLPPVQTSGTVQYLSGGVGESEAGAVKAAAKDWPLTLEFAVRDGKGGQYAADVKVVVRDAKGATTLEATAKGPFLLAKLVPGRYEVEATFAGKTLHEGVTVAVGKPAKAVFVWPQGTGISKP